MSEMLSDALDSTDIMELCRASRQLFTMPTTSYRDMNACIRGHGEMDEWHFNRTGTDVG
jgi:hypothetical protein